MNRVTYPMRYKDTNENAPDLTIEYDETSPCIYCEQSVGGASMDGVIVCACCDMGIHRDTGIKWTLDECLKFGNKAKTNRIKVKSTELWEKIEENVWRYTHQWRV